MYGAEFRRVPQTEVSLSSPRGVMDSINSWQQQTPSTAKHRSSFEPRCPEFLHYRRGSALMANLSLQSLWRLSSYYMTQSTHHKSHCQTVWHGQGPREIKTLTSQDIPKVERLPPRSQRQSPDLSWDRVKVFAAQPFLVYVSVIIFNPILHIPFANFIGQREKATERMVSCQPR